MHCLSSRRLGSLGERASYWPCDDVGFVQATVGTLVAKTLTSSTSNPYAAAGQAARTTTPTALDAFSVQVSGATLLFPSQNVHTSMRVRALLPRNSHLEAQA